MGLKSTSDGFNNLPKFNNKHEMSLGVSGEWDEFYRQATKSKEVFLVKTHRPPRDEQPAIYIVRDGRKSCLSYSYFHQSHSSSPFPSLLEIVMGHDFYGSWSEHYRMWAARDNVMILRFEELVNASEPLLMRLAEWVRYSGEITPWVNPFEEEKRRAPDLVREGKIEWQSNDPAWTLLVNAIFFHFHGDLMVELGYVKLADVDEARRGVSYEILQLADISNRLYREKHKAEKLVIELQKLIQRYKIPTLSKCIGLVIELKKSIRSLMQHIQSIKSGK